MRVRSRSTFIGVVVLAVTLSLLGGCGKKKAQTKIDEASAKQGEADAQQMSTYMPDQYKAATNLVRQANDQFTAGDYEQAFNSAEQAIGRFENSMTQLGNLRQEIDGLWDQIEENKTTIQGHLAVATEKAFLPQEELEQLNGELFAIGELTDDSLKKPEPKGSVDREFLKSAIEKYEQLSKKTQLASIAHLKPQAEEALTVIREKWAEAQSLDAEKYKPQAFTEIKAAVAGIEDEQAAGKWQTVIDTGSSLQAQLDTLLEQTRIAASDAKVNEAAEKLGKALAIQAPEVTEYAQFLGDAQKAVQRAKEAQGAGQAAEAFAGAEEALDLIQSAQLALGDNVTKYLEAAEASLQEAIGKEARTYAADALSKAEGLISTAKTALSEERYSDAFQAGQAAQQAASKVVIAAQEGKARTLLQGVEKRLQQLASQGARDRVAEVYGKAQEEIAKLQRALSASQYDQVTAGVADADAAVTVVHEALAKAAAEAIGVSDKALAQAKGALDEVKIASTDGNRLMAEASRAREEAAQAADAARFGTAFERAQKSVDVAAKAEAAAYADGAQAALRETAAVLNTAREAAAPTESPQAYRDALDVETSAKDALSAGQAQLAFRRSLDAQQAAQDALYNLIHKAGQAVDDARSAQAGVYSPEDLKQAEVLYNKARDAHRGGNYADSNSLAKHAAGLAAEAESFAWRQRSTALLADLQVAEADLATYDANGRAPESAVAFRKHFALAKAAHIGREWEKAYAEADAADRAANAAWQTMDDEITARLTAVRDCLSEAASIADDPEERDQIEVFTAQVDPVLNAQALRDYNLGYDLSAQLVAASDAYLKDLQWENRSQAADRLHKRLNERLNDGSAEVLATETAELEAFINELEDDESEVGYGTLMAQVQAWDGRLDDMPDRSLTDATPRLEAVSAQLSAAREFDAERLYPKYLREVEAEYNMTSNAVLGKNSRDVADRLMKLEKQADELVAAARLAKEEADYKEEIGGYMEQMQTLLHDFGSIAGLNKTILKTMRATSTTLESEVATAYNAMQSVMSARTLRLNAELLEQQVRGSKPPETSKMKRLYKLAIQSASDFSKAAAGFDAYGDTDRYELHYRNQRVEEAYEYLEAVLRTNSEIEFILSSTPETTWREKWNRKSKVAKQEFRRAMFDEVNFKTEKYEDKFFRWIFRVEDVQNQAR